MKFVRIIKANTEWWKKYYNLGKAAPVDYDYLKELNFKGQLLGRLENKNTVDDLTLYAQELDPLLLVQDMNGSTYPIKFNGPFYKVTEFEVVQALKKSSLFNDKTRKKIYDLLAKYDKINHIWDDHLAEDHPLYTKVYNMANKLGLNPNYAEYDSYGFQPNGMIIQSQENTKFPQELLNYIHSLGLEIDARRKTRVEPKVKSAYYKIKFCLYPKNLTEDRIEYLRKNSIPEEAIKFFFSKDFENED